jgi:hypothetical protein
MTRKYDADYGRLLITVRTLAASGALFDDEARKQLATELREAAARLDPKPGRILRRLVASEYCDPVGRKLYRVVS